jgi:predicted CxxxxCH...CXXCH cytochrome family protein
VDDAGEIIVSGGLHINGQVDKTTECYSCHGTAGVNEAPPVALDGSTATTSLGVGAHQAHLAAGQISSAIPCESCHVVPETEDSPHHQPEGDNDTSAEVIFSGMSLTDGSTPIWNRDTAQCSDVYCHGSTLTGGTHTSPQWTLVDESQVECDGCHGDPPPWPHPQSPQSDKCATCHPGTVNGAGEIIVSGGLHINGQVDKTTECYSCHGTAGVNEAPPVALDGSTATSALGVGAHQAHLAAGQISSAIPCESCHVVPETEDSPHHQPEGDNDTSAEVIFSGMSLTDGSTPIWNRDTAQCSDVYCHGSTLTGGTHTSPQWTLVDESQVECDGCHGDPPPWPHPQSPQSDKCATCHPGTVDDAGEIIVSGGLHINGQVDAQTQCYSCHGTEGANAAPPVALDGSTETSALGVGAHQAHLVAGRIAAPVPCEECHWVPDTLDSQNHIDSNLPAEVTFGTLASSGTDVPTWNRDLPNPHCTNVYCHGASLGGGNMTTPTWTQVDGSQITCESCHGFPPPEPHYQGQDYPCEFCHPRTVVGGQTINISSGTHIDGEVTFF